jgi:Tfp pilus assembly protein PilN
MININLLPPEYAPKKLVSVVNLAMIFIFFLIGLSMIWSSKLLLAQVHDYSQQVNYHNQQIELYRQQVEDIQELKDTVKRLRERLSLVKELLEENTIWSNKLMELARNLPRDGAWIDNLSIERDNRQQQRSQPRGRNATQQNSSQDIMEPVTVRVSGSVISVDTLSEFVANLEDSETFTNVVLESVGGQSSGENELYKNFRLSVQVLVPSMGS